MSAKEKKFRDDRPIQQKQRETVDLGERSWVTSFTYLPISRPEGSQLQATVYNGYAVRKLLCGD